MDVSQTNSERTAAADTTGELGLLRTFETAARLRLLNCPACGIAFALPESFRLFKNNENQPVFCPAGHGFTPIDMADKPTELMAQVLCLSAELLSVRHRALQSEREAARLRPFEPAAGTVTYDEFKRRCNILAARAEVSPAEYGKRICKFCGKTFRGEKHVRNHLLRTHRPEVEDLSPHLFK